jgi:hypothetical protein
MDKTAYNGVVKLAFYAGLPTGHSSTTHLRQFATDDCDADTLIEKARSQNDAQFLAGKVVNFVKTNYDTGSQNTGNKYKNYRVQKQSWKDWKPKSQFKKKTNSGTYCFICKSKGHRLADCRKLDQANK